MLVVNSKFIPLLRKQRTLLKKVPDQEVVGLFYDSLVVTFNAAKVALPKQPTNILDIGCGLGGIDVLISDYYQHKPFFTLLDGSFVNEELHYGFQSSGEFYSNLAWTKEFLEANGVFNTVFIDITKEMFPVGSFDLIISFASWGFHYPISVYANRVIGALAKESVLILELRKDTFSMDEIRHFGEPIVLQDQTKRTMFAFRKTSV